MNNAAPPSVAAAIRPFAHHAEVAENEAHAQPKSGPMPNMLPRPHTSPPTNRSEANSGSTARASREMPTKVTRRSIASIFRRASLSSLSDSSTAREPLNPECAHLLAEPLKIAPETVHELLDDVIEVLRDPPRHDPSNLLSVQRDMALRLHLGGELTQGRSRLRQIAAELLHHRVCLQLGGAHAGAVAHFHDALV